MDDDLIDEQTANIKFIIVQTDAPSPVYDGQVHIDTDDDPPLIRIYDTTNTMWLQRKHITYDTVNNEYPSESPVLNGSLQVRYDSGSTQHQLLTRANSKWWAVTSG